MRPLLEHSDNTRRAQMPHIRASLDALRALQDDPTPCVRCVELDCRPMRAVQLVGGRAFCAACAQSWHAGSRRVPPTRAGRRMTLGLARMRLRAVMAR